MANLVDISLNEIIKSKNLETLKSCGTYREVKTYLKYSTGLPLKGRGWASLFDQLQILSSSIDTNYSELIVIFKNKCSLREIGKFKKAKTKISEYLSFPITARSWNALEVKVEKILSIFLDGNSSENIYDIYEKNKIRNFEASSELEGIKIDTRQKKMVDVINKYRVNV